MLALLTAAVGRPSETYIASHASLLFPGATSVCSFSAQPQPYWTPPAPVFHLKRSRLSRFRARDEDPLLLTRFEIARLAYWLASTRPRVVLCEYLQVAIPVVAHSHGYDLSAQLRQPGWSELYARVLPSLAAIVIVSPCFRPVLQGLGVSTGRIHVIPCGVPVPEPSRLRSHTLSPAARGVAVGRLVAKKGPIFLAESIRLIRQSLPDFRCRIVGDGPFLEPLRQFLAAHRMQDAVELAGPLPHADSLAAIAAADIFLQHSVTAADGDQEGLPVSILEAFAAGVPVVSTHHAGIPDAVVDSQCGFLVPPGDCAAMARGAVQLLREPALRASFARAAHERLRLHFDQNRNLDSLRALLLTSAAP
jgi:colanic acid/amylovoran biosynthesis glycosyltransferase